MPPQSYWKAGRSANRLAFTHYFDTSALVPVYVPEAFPATARAWAVRAQQIPFIPLHRLEFFNAIERLVGRGQIGRREQAAITAELQSDLDARRVLPAAIDFDKVVDDSVDLSRQLSAKFLVRSLDLAHLAAARRIGCKAFVSADDRQLSAAKVVGFDRVDIKKASRAPR